MIRADSMISWLPDGAVPLALAGLVDDCGAIVLHAGTTTGLYTTQNGGWQSVEVPGADATAVSALTVTVSGDGDPVILGGLNGGVIRLDPGAATWSTVSLGSPPPLVTCFAGSGQRLLAGSLEDGAFQSDDGGVAWRSANIGLLDMAIYGLACVTGANCRDLALAATETTVFLSENGGRTWRGTGLDVGDAPVQAIAAVPASDLIVVGTGGAGLFRTTMDAGHWETTANLLPSSQVVSLHVIDRDADETAVVAVLDTGVAVSADGAATWRYAGVELDSGTQIVSSCVVSRSQPQAALVIGLDNGCVRIIPDILAASR